MGLKPVRYRTSDQRGDAAKAAWINPLCKYVCGKLPHIVFVTGSMSSGSNPTDDMTLCARRMRRLENSDTRDRR
jgi:hypothetical protein